MEVTKILLKKIRFGYEHVFEKSSANAKSEPKYSVEVLIPHSDKEQIKIMQDAIKLHSDDFAKNAKGGKLPKDFEVRFFDGDDDLEYEHRAGHMYFSAKSTQTPGIYGTQKDENGKPVPIGKGDFKGGDYGNVSIGVYTYKEGGVAFFLNGLQKVKNGEAISGGGGNSASDFAELDNDVDAGDDDLG